MRNSNQRNQLAFAPMATLRLADDGGLPLTQEGVVLIPDGVVPNANGRPLVMNESNAQQVIERFERQGVDLAIDFNHASLEAEDLRREGKYADPKLGAAMGYIKKGSLKYVKGRGITGTVEWLVEGAELVEAERYKYLSPVVIVNTETGDVIRLLGAGLTNEPAIENMGELMAASERILKKFGELDMPDNAMAPSSSPEQLAGEIKQLLIQKGVEIGEDADLSMIMQAVKSFMMGMVDGGSDEDAAAPADEEVAANSEVIRNAERRITELSDEILELRTSLRDRDAAALVQEGIESGKLHPNNEEQLSWAKQEAMSDPDRFRKTLSFMADVRPPQGRITPRVTEPTPDIVNSSGDEDRLIEEALKENDNNVRVAYVSLQKKLLGEAQEHGYSRQHAMEQLTAQYPKIFG